MMTMNDLDLTLIHKRSEPVIVNTDGVSMWAGNTYPTREAAYEARRILRAVTFGMIYGGGKPSILKYGEV